MASASGGSGTWGRPRIEWVDPQNLGAPPFVLDDATEAGEWLGFDVRIRGVARTMDSMLVSLQGALRPYQVWHACAYGFFLMLFRF
jgi:hypothetical protein